MAAAGTVYASPGKQLTVKGLANSKGTLSVRARGLSNSITTKKGAQNMNQEK